MRGRCVARIAIDGWLERISELAGTVVGST